MKLGDLEVQFLDDGLFRLDGGAMFGVVPKPLWQRVAPADERNRIALAMNSLLIRAAGKCILVDTGAGDKWNAKFREIYAFEGARLPDQLAARGVRPEDVDIVVNTHLHFDHCGWNTRLDGAGFVPTFPNARYVVHAGELEDARHPNERNRASYIPENFEPIAAAKKWQLVESDDHEIVPGVRLIRAPGHTRDMMCLQLSGGGQTAMFLADLVPTTAHLPPAWMMGFDLYPLTTLEHKKKWLGQIAGREWLALFGHDTKIRAARLRESNGIITAEPVTLD